MANDKMCIYENKGGGGSRRSDSWRNVDHTDEDFGQKRVRVKCPECGRRMTGWAVVTNDGEIVRYAIPPHKRKKWWKRKKGC